MYKLSTPLNQIPVYGNESPFLRHHFHCFAVQLLGANAAGPQRGGRTRQLSARRNERDDLVLVQRGVLSTAAGVRLAMAVGRIRRSGRGSIVFGQKRLRPDETEHDGQKDDTVEQAEDDDEQENLSENWYVML